MTIKPIDLTALRKMANQAKERADKAFAGPWNIWEGPEYEGGGADLCIGAGEEWLGNMDHRFCVNKDRHIDHYIQQDCAKEPFTDICSIGEDVTAEQRANAEFIVSSRSDVPDLADAVLVLANEVERLQANTPASIRGAWMKAWYGPF